MMCKNSPFGSLLGSLLLVGTFSTVLWAEAPSLKVSENKRFLQTSDGKPFFWLGDTAWELFHRLNREEAIRYLDNRQALGFTVVQAVALAELDGLNSPNPYGKLPLRNLDPTQPAIEDGDENDYWDHVDFIVREANKRGIVIGLLPTWGDKWNKKWGKGPEIFDVENAGKYGEWLGKRYADASVVWILGGDRPIESDLHREITASMAEGLRRGDGGKHLITWHPTGNSGSSKEFHDAKWLDFNMRQNGHNVEFNGPYVHTHEDYLRQPVKPVVDGEPLYEGHPIAFNAKNFGHSLASDVRRPLYWNLFTGAFGHTYGHHSVWQMWQEGREPVNAPLMSWDAAILQPGASQMQHAKKLLLSRPFLTRIPDSSLVVADRVATSVPGAGRYAFAATRDSEGTYALIYVPAGIRFQVNAKPLTCKRLVASWFDPRNGMVTPIGTIDNTEEPLEFEPPQLGEEFDWVLILDDEESGYPLQF